MSVYSDVVDAINGQNWRRLRQALRHEGTRNPRNFFRHGLPHPYILALDQSDERVVSPALKILVESGFDINLELNNKRDYLDCWRLIGGAALKSKLSVVSYLIGCGAEIDWDTQPGTGSLPPLSTACLFVRSRTENQEIIKILLDAGAATNTQASPPPLHCLFAGGKAESEISLVHIANLLIEYGADVNFAGRIFSFNSNMDRIGVPLFAYWNSGYELVKFALEQGADKSAVLDTGETVLDFF
ncbi:MAG: hypothetical protein H6843_13965 [Rhodospirillaceae bacterium]|nr:hypothetical protein [Rhodospirillaceae bacterium]